MADEWVDGDGVRVECMCGCGNTLDPYAGGRRAEFIHGHNLARGPLPPNRVQYRRTDSKWFDAILRRLRAGPATVAELCEYTGAGRGVVLRACAFLYRRRRVARVVVGEVYAYTLPTAGQSARHVMRVISHHELIALATAASVGRLLGGGRVATATVKRLHDLGCLDDGAPTDLGRDVLDRFRELGVI